MNRTESDDQRLEAEGQRAKAKTRKPHPLKGERELRGWSQAKVAEEVGTNTRTVLRWEQGQSVPYPYHRELLCKLFNKDARTLGLLEEPKEDQPQESDVPERDPHAPVFDPELPVFSGSSGLVGREHLLAEVKQRLWEGGSFALTALYGLPGMGKTSLAMALAADKTVRDRFAHGILWAGLGQEANVLGHLARWGKLLGIAPAEVENVQDKEGWARALRAAIGQHRMLLVIDDAWSIEDVLALQIGGAECAHLVTTRLPQVAFAFAKEGAFLLSELKDNDGLALLAQFVSQLTRDDPEHALELVHAVGGSPLALKLMGNYLAAQAFTGQERRLQRALKQLHDAEYRLSLSMPLSYDERSPSLPPGTPLSLHAVIAVSDQRLSTQAHATLLDLALFPPKPNSFSEEAALAVSAASVDTLDELWDAGLLEYSGSARYMLHQTITDYTLAQRKETSAQQRLLKYCTWYVQTHSQDYAALEHEQPMLQAALDLANSTSSAELIQMGMLLVPYWRVRGHYALADRFLSQALRVARERGEEYKQMALLRDLALFAELRGEYGLAEDYSRQGLTLAQPRDDTAVIRSALLTTLGLVVSQHNYKEARRLFEEGLDLARKTGEQEHICILLSHLGLVINYQGDHTLAEVHYQEGLTLARQMGHQEHICHFLTSLGGIVLEQGNYALAESYFQEGLELACALGYRKEWGALLNNMGVLAAHRGSLEQAALYFQDALELARQIGMRADICLCLSNLGEAAAELHNYAQAEQYLREGTELARQLENRNNLALLLSNLGRVLGEQGYYEQANAFFQESLDLSRALRSSWYIYNALVAWGWIHLKQQQLEEASALFQEVLADEKQTENDPLLLAMARYGLARIAGLQHNIVTARNLGKLCLTQFSALGHRKTTEVVDWLKTLPDETLFPEA